MIYIFDSEHPSIKAQIIIHANIIFSEIKVCLHLFSIVCTYFFFFLKTFKKLLSKLEVFQYFKVNLHYSWNNREKIISFIPMLDVVPRTTKKNLCHILFSSPRLFLRRQFLFQLGFSPPPLPPCLFFLPLSPLIFILMIYGQGSQGASFMRCATSLEAPHELFCFCFSTHVAGFQVFKRK